jgi:adsorption protein B
MSLQSVMAETAAELALFASLGFLLFSLDDLAVDLIYFCRRLWRAATVYRRHARGDARSMVEGAPSGWMVVMIPAWDEHSVIGAMLQNTLRSFDHPDYTLLVGYYRNDPATRLAIEAVADPRVMAVEVPADGPTTKADCLNHLYAFLLRQEAAAGRQARAVVLHDAEDLVHPLELKLFDRLSGRAGVVQLPVVPRWFQSLDRRPLLRRVRRISRQGTGGARGGRRGHSAGGGRLRDFAARHGPAGGGA